MTRYFHLLLISVIALVLALPDGALAARQKGGEDGGCDEKTSTPELVITGKTTGRSRLKIIAQTNKKGTPHGTVQYSKGSARLVGMEIHRAFLATEGEEGGGHDGGHATADHASGLRAGLRGAGRLDTGETVRVHVDIQDLGSGNTTDRVRVRWRAFQSHAEAANPVLASRGDCQAQWLYDSGWMKIRRVTIRQRSQ